MTTQMVHKCLNVIQNSSSSVNEVRNKRMFLVQGQIVLLPDARVLKKRHHNKISSPTIHQFSKLFERLLKITLN